MLTRTMAAVLAVTAVSLVRADYETLNVFGSIGAGFGMGGRLYSSTEFSNNTTTVTDRFFNYGSGMKFDAGCQYFMMENVALQPSFAYSVGLPFKEETRAGDSNITTTFRRHLFGIKALVVPRFEVLDLLDMYAGVGVGFFWNARPFKILVETPMGSQEAKGRITSKPAVGLVGQLGADYPINDKLTLFGELAFEQVRFNLSKYIIKESTVTTLNSGTQYYSKDDNNPQNLDPEKVPGSNWQIRIGIRYAIKTD
ncbi:MAG: outer membrane beta-barrel protein [Chitinispirillaceae bacterium]|nr:outer membrane beta-barrel protein [Chitinispirillaceae bacterium]